MGLFSARLVHSFLCSIYGVKNDSPKNMPWLRRYVANSLVPLRPKVIKYGLRFLKWTIRNVSKLWRNSIEFTLNFQFEKKVPKKMLDWSTKDSKTTKKMRVAFGVAFLISTRLVHWQTQAALPDFALSAATWRCSGNSCLPPLENSMPCMAWVAWVDQSSRLGNDFIDFWLLLFSCHYLLNYAKNRCMHMPLVNCISIVTDLYNIHYDGYYLKYDEITHRKEVNFCRGAHSTNPCGK